MYFGKGASVEKMENVALSAFQSLVTSPMLCNSVFGRPVTTDATVADAGLFPYRQSFYLAMM